MELKTFERLFELKKELDTVKATVETLTRLQCHAEKLRQKLAIEDEGGFCYKTENFPWRPFRVSPLQYIELVADSNHRYKHEVTEDEWNAIVETAIKLKTDRIKEIEEEVKAI